MYMYTDMYYMYMYGCLSSLQGIVLLSVYVCCLSIARRYSTDVLSIKAWDVQDFYFLYQHFSIWFIHIYIYI